MFICPGLAISLVDYREDQDNPVASLAYEVYNYEYKRGDSVFLTDYEGSPLQEAVVIDTVINKVSRKTQIIKVRVSTFDTARLIRGWAGLYAMNRIDGNGIIGHFGDVEGFYSAVGFSGHGLQQSPAIGKCISELIQFGKYRTIDLSCFSFHRFETGKLVFEEEIV